MLCLNLLLKIEILLLELRLEFRQSYGGCRELGGPLLHADFKFIACLSHYLFSSPAHSNVDYKRKRTLDTAALVIFNDR